METTEVSILSQKEWMELIRRCLDYLNKNNPISKSLFKDQIYVLPNNFTQSPTHFCYAYKGVFLPSGNLDGMVWKPSQGAKPNGKGLFKRYFYCNKENVKINRQVLWLSENENWCFVDYRHNLKGKIRLQDIQTPEGFDFKGLLKLAWNPPTRESLLPPPSSIPTSKKRKEMENNSSPSKKINQASLASSSTVNTQLPSKSSTSVNDINNRRMYACCVHKGCSHKEKIPYLSPSPTPLDTLLSLEIPVASPSTFGLFSSIDNLEYTSLLNSQPIKRENNNSSDSIFEAFSEESDSLFPSSPHDFDFTSLDFDGSSNKVIPSNSHELFLSQEKVSSSFHFPISTPAILSNIQGEKSESDDENNDVEFSEPNKKRKLNNPSFFSSPMEYLYDMISNKLIIQIIFKRHFFRKFEEETTQDYNQFLEKVKRQSVTVDLREFPTPVLKNFFSWVAEIFFHLRPEDLPPLYCIVCGHTDAHHDELVHGMFYTLIDQNLVAAMQERPMTVPELCKAFITFLLKNPESHQPLTAFVSQYFYCPFCACKKGQHRSDRHEKWQVLFHIDPKHRVLAPEPSNNVHDGVKSTFSWLTGYVPVSIPPFLLSFHYVRYLQSFLDCLVTLWQTVRL